MVFRIGAMVEINELNNNKYCLLGTSVTQGGCSSSIIDSDIDIFGRDGDFVKNFDWVAPAVGFLFAIMRGHNGTYQCI